MINFLLSSHLFDFHFDSFISSTEKYNQHNWMNMHRKVKNQSQFLLNKK